MFVSKHGPISNRSALLKADRSVQTTRLHRNVVVRNQDDKQKDLSLGDRLLDYVTAGPKLRRWYGQGDILPSDVGPDSEKQPEPQEEPVGPREFVLVTDAEGIMGEAVLLELILLRASVKAVVKDVVAARTGFGPYVTPVPVPASTSPKAFRDVRCLVVTGRPDPAVLSSAKAGGVQHIVTVVSEPSGSGPFGLFGPPDDAVLSDKSRAAACKDAGFSCTTIVNIGRVKDSPGGRNELSLTAKAGAAAAAGAEPISRQDVASAVARIAAQELPASPSGPVARDLLLRVGAPAAGPVWAEGAIPQI